MHMCNMKALISDGKKVMAKVKVFVQASNADADADTRAMTLAPRHSSRLAKNDKQCYIVYYSSPSVIDQSNLSPILRQEGKYYKQYNMPYHLLFLFLRLVMTTLSLAELFGEVSEWKKSP